jgi:hypothetical protein
VSVTRVRPSLGDGAGGVPAPRRIQSGVLSLDDDLVDDDRLERPVAGRGVGGGDRVDDLLRLVVGDLTEDRVLAVQVRGRHDGHEELRAVGAVAVLDAGVGHREQVRTVELELRVDLVVELVPGRAGAGAERAAALDHEPVDHPVEAEAVVERLADLLAGLRVGPLLGALGQADEVAHRLRRVVGEQPDDDVALVRLQGCVELFGHGSHS